LRDWGAITICISLPFFLQGSIQIYGPVSTQGGSIIAKITMGRIKLEDNRKRDGISSEEVL
jgi:hypothetical protein